MVKSFKEFVDQSSGSEVIDFKSIENDLVLDINYSKKDVDNYIENILQESNRYKFRAVHYYPEDPEIDDEYKSGPCGVIATAAIIGTTPRNVWFNLGLRDRWATSGIKISSILEFLSERDFIIIENTLNKIIMNNDWGITGAACLEAIFHENLGNDRFLITTRNPDGLSHGCAVVPVFEWHDTNSDFTLRNWYIHNFKLVKTTIK